MRKQDLQNERLDEIGRRLLEAAALHSVEIERIAAAPHLFESVRAKIKTEQNRRKPQRFVFNFRHWQTATGAFALLIVFAIGAAALIFKSKDAQQLTAHIESPEIKTNVAPDETTPELPKIVEMKSPAVKNPLVAAKVDFKRETPKLNNRARKQNLVNPEESPKKESEGVFYSLALAGNWEADGEDLQVVRAELSPAELFALGVNLPVENESAKVKTDLLVGSNGVPRAIRFVE